MRSDLVKAAMVLGVCILLAAAVLVVGMVLGMRWAIDSALASHLPGLGQTVEQTGLRLETSVESSATRVVAGVDAGAAQVATTNEQMAQLDATLAAGSMTVAQTMGEAFEKPMLISAPAGIGIMGGDGQSVRVQASVALGEENGSGD